MGVIIYNILEIINFVIMVLLMIMIVKKISYLHKNKGQLIKKGVKISLGILIILFVFTAICFIGNVVNDLHIHRNNNIII